MRHAITPLKIGIGYLSLLTPTPERLQKLKVQMKRSVTGGEDRAAAHKGKALVLRCLGAKQRLY